mmetsp:Transcript_6179/g.9093  ORF Transcript_6179/g.9093 Transcript_6179/m.9093 type:complete len:646 (-) Transcript_6179:522-2459(-)
MSAITTTTAIATTAFLFPTTSNAFSTIAQNAYTDWVANNGGNYQVSALLPAGDPTSANIAVHWSIIDDKIHLAVTAEATGWLGFGFAEAGGMPGSDIAVFTASTGKLTDAYATDYAAPIDDDQQDWTLKNYTLDGGFIIWEGERLLKTCDNQDWEVRDDSGVDMPPHKVIAAWGDSTSMSFHGLNSEKGEIRFYGSGEETVSFHAAMDAEAEGSAVLTAPSFTLPQWKTLYKTFCYTKDDLVAQGLPSDGSAHIIGIEPVLDNSNSITNVHHILVYSSEDSTCDEDGEDLMFPWAFGQRNFQAPSPAGFRFGSVGEGAFQSITMEFHYDNPEYKDNIVDNSGFRFYYTTKLRQHDIGFFELADPKVSLLGKKVGNGVTQHTFSCPGSCTNNFSQDVTVFLEGLHMHALGERMVSKHFRNDEVLRESSVDYYDFSQAGMYSPQQNEYVLKRGDGFEITCYFKAGNYDLFGLGSENEMCINFLGYYPKQFGVDNYCGLAPTNSCLGSYSKTTLGSLEDTGREFGTREAISDPSCPVPSSAPSSMPVGSPTSSPTASPSVAPVSAPVPSPSSSPVVGSSKSPSLSPSSSPTKAPLVMTNAPVVTPSTDEDPTISPVASSSSNTAGTTCISTISILVGSVFLGIVNVFV